MPASPNILLITTHDSGRHFGCYGVPTVRTPRIDRLASEGVRLSRCFGTAPICCAARASMLTGTYPQTNGQMDLFFPPFNWRMREPRWHASHVMRERGYDTCLLGVQHEVHDAALLGFDERRMDRELTSAPELAAGVAAYLRERGEKRSAGRPFFAQVGFFETHAPFEWKGCEPDDSRGVWLPPQLKDSPTARRVMAMLQGAIRRVDDAVGVIDDALRAAGLAEETILIFTTDHGLELPRAKWHLYDAGIETAMVLHWPGGGVTGGRECDELISHVDLLPTILELGDRDTPGHVQGRSFAGLLRGEPRPFAESGQGLRETEVGSARDSVFAIYQKSASRCVRTRRHKLIRHFTIASLAGVQSSEFMRYNPDSLDVVEHLRRRKVVDLYPSLELYDLEADPAEFVNLARESGQRGALAELDTRLWRWMETVNDPLLRGPERTPVYDQAMDAYRAWREGSR